VVERERNKNPVLYSSLARSHHVIRLEATRFGDRQQTLAQTLIDQQTIHV
jgi:hypothetical protein